MDIYYATRTRDLDDRVPKHHGAWASNLALTPPLLKLALMPGQPLRSA